MNLRSRIARAAVAMFALFAAAAASAAPAVLTPDLLASWEVFVGGERAGAETVSAAAGSLSAAGGFTYQGTRVDTSYALALDPAGRPASYEATIAAAGRKAEIKTSIAGSVMTVKVWQSGNLLAQKDLPIGGNAVILDNNVASQYRQLSRLLDPGTPGKASLRLLVPSAVTSLAADAVVQKGGWTWKLGAASGSAVRWELSSAAVPPISIWQDAGSREILAVEITAAKVRYALAGVSLAQDAALARPAADAAEKELTVVTGSLAMGATLAYPRTGTGPFPGVLLVAGSGPNDRDETVGPNKPLRDIAVGLASAGFAVLRFDKRTFAYQKNPGALSVPSMTVREEFIDDAVSAFRTLAVQPNVDAARLSIVGHSLGAWGLPYIVEGLGADAGRLRHLVFLAPAGRDFGAMLLRQLRFRLSLAPDNLAAKAAVAEAEKGISEYRAKGSLSAGFMGATAAYWNDLFARDPVARVKGIAADMLFVRGSKDIQVDAADLGTWQAGLGSAPNASFTTLPGLNHLFMEVDGESTGSEYFHEGTVSRALVDLAAARLRK
jgi:hypothetical protein